MILKKIKTKNYSRNIQKQKIEKLKNPYKWTSDEKSSENKL